MVCALCQTALEPLIFERSLLSIGEASTQGRPLHESGRAHSQVQTMVGLEFVKCAKFARTRGAATILGRARTRTHFDPRDFQPSCFRSAARVAASSPGMFSGSLMNAVSDSLFFTVGSLMFCGTAPFFFSSASAELAMPRKPPLPA